MRRFANIETENSELKKKVFDLEETIKEMETMNDIEKEEFTHKLALAEERVKVREGKKEERRLNEIERKLKQDV